VIRLPLVAEFPDAVSIEEARLLLDHFREAVLVSAYYGITLYENPDQERMRWALDAVADILAEPSWSSDTLDDVANVLRANGYPLNDPRPCLDATFRGLALLPEHDGSQCPVCGDLSLDADREFCVPCGEELARDLAQIDQTASHPGSRCSDACGQCGRCGGA